MMKQFEGQIEESMNALVDKHDSVGSRILQSEANETKNTNDIAQYVDQNEITQYVDQNEISVELPTISTNPVTKKPAEVQRMPAAEGEKGCCDGCIVF